MSTFPYLGGYFSLPERGYFILPPDTAFGQTMGLTKSFYDKALQVGATFIENGKIEEAKKVFGFLSQADPFNIKFTLALADAYFVSKDYQTSIYFYTIATDLAANDEAYLILLLISDALINLEKIDVANEVIEYVIEQTQGKEEFNAEFSAAQETKELIANK